MKLIFTWMLKPYLFFLNIINYAGVFSYLFVSKLIGKDAIVELHYITGSDKKYEYVFSRWFFCHSTASRVDSIFVLIVVAS